jgi:hypothetical protein
MKKITYIFPLILALALAGCSAAGDYIGTERGIDTEFNGVMYDMKGLSTTYKHNTESPLGTLSVRPDGSMTMTGPAVEVWVQAWTCDRNPALCF